MSVDTYLGKRKSTAGYQIVRHNEVQVLVSSALARAARSIHVRLKRFVLWKYLSAEIEPVGDHIHGPACNH